MELIEQVLHSIPYKKLEVTGTVNLKEEEEEEGEDKCLTAKKLILFNTASNFCRQTRPLLEIK